MLKKRIIPVQLLIGGRLVKTIRFDRYRDVGDPVKSSKIYSDCDADELVFLNIERDNRSIRPLLVLIEKVSEVCFMPLALGGGVVCLEDAVALIKSGADKVVLNSACYRDTSLISRIADRFGNQAVVVSIDARFRAMTGRYELYSNCGRSLEPVNLGEHVEAVTSAGAGEIFINSIDKEKKICYSMQAWWM